MKTPASWIVIEKRSAPFGDGTITTLVPTSSIVEVSMMVDRGFISDLRIKCSTSHIFAVPSDSRQEVAEALGILEALGQKAPPPAGDVEDARRYRKFKSLLFSNPSLNMGLVGDSANLDATLDNLTDWPRSL